MADRRSSLPIRGNVIDGQAEFANNTLLGVVGSDGTNYYILAVDANGKIETAHDSNTNPQWNRITDGTDDLDVVKDNDVEDSGLLVFGSDGTNVHPLTLDDAGNLYVTMSEGSGDTEIYDVGNAVIAKDTPATVHSYSPAAGTEYITGIQVSGSGLMKIDVKWGVTASEVSKLVYFNSVANPNVIINLPESIDLASTDTILVECTNLENASSPTSDFTAYVAIIGHV